MKTVCLKVSVSCVKTNILFDGAISAKVKLFFSVMQRDTGLFTQQDLIAITGLCIDHQKVSYSPERIVWYLFAWQKENNLTFAVIAPSRKMFVFAELTLTLRQTVCIRN